MPTPLQHGIERFARFVAAVESRPWSLGRIAAVLAGIIALRNLLEISVANNPAPPLLALFAHYPLAYVGPFLALTLTLATWAGVPPVRVARLMMLAWTLTLVPPLMDLLLHPGTDRPVIAYLQADPVDLPFVWARFFDPRVALSGTTPGIRLEALVGVLLGAFYVWLRSRSTLRALGAALCIYVVSLFFFTLPLLLQTAFDTVLQPAGKQGLYHGQSMLVRANVAAADDATATLWLALVILGLGAAWSRLEARHAKKVAAAGEEPSAPSMPALAAIAFLGGAIAAAWIHRPVDVAIVLVPWDVLALVAGTTSVFLASRLVLGQAPRSDLTRGVSIVAILAVACALGAPAALGMAAAAGVLVPLGTRIVPRLGALGALSRALLFPLAAFAAVHAGYALVEGSNAAARLPGRVTVPFVLAALIAALAPGVRFGRMTVAWLAGAALAGIVAAFSFGTPDATVLALAAVAAPCAVAAAATGSVVGRILARAPAARASGFALGAWGLLVLVLALNQAPIRTALAGEARCVARLELLRGQAYEKAGHWKPARTAFLRALECEPDYLPALQALGIVYARNSARPDHALEYFERAIEIDPGSPRNLNNLAALLVTLDRAGEALPLLERSLTLDPRSPIARFQLAGALDALGREEEALEAWQDYRDAARGRESEAASVHHARERMRALRRSLKRGAPKTGGGELP